MSDYQITVQPASAIKLTLQPAQEISLALSVGQGPAGVAGAAGPGSIAPFNFLTPATTWTINHNQGRRVLVGLFSVGGLEMYAEVLQVSINQVLVTFDSPTAGYAIIS